MMMAMGLTASGGGTISIVQSNTSSNDTLATTQTCAFSSAITTGNKIIFAGFLQNDTTAANGITLTVTDDKGSTWTVDQTNDPGGGSGKKAFIASCLSPNAGVTTMTVSFGGTVTMRSRLFVLEASSVGSRGSSASYSSNGSNVTSTNTITNSAANTKASSLAVHVAIVDLFSNTIGLTATPGTGSFVTEQVNQQAQPASTHLPIGIAGYTLDTATGTDSVADTWTGGAAPLCAILQTYQST